MTQHQTVDDMPEAQQLPCDSFYVICPICEECHEVSGGWAKGDVIDCICGTSFRISNRRNT